jgi:hypothetical protein
MWATQYNTPNNLAALKFPGVVNDGRSFTSYDPEHELNDKLRKAHNIQTNRDYKRFLVDHAPDIMKRNMQAALVENRVWMPTEPQLKQGSLYLYKDVHDQTKPFGFESSFPKSMYMSREQLDDKKRRPLVPSVHV